MRPVKGATRRKKACSDRKKIQFDVPKKEPRAKSGEMHWIRSWLTSIGYWGFNVPSAGVRCCDRIRRHVVSFRPTGAWLAKYCHRCDMGHDIVHRSSSAPSTATQAIHAKLAELLRAVGKADSALAMLDLQEPEEIEAHREHRELSSRKQVALPRSVDPEMEATMPVLLWFLGVPIVVVIALMLTHVI